MKVDNDVVIYADSEITNPRNENLVTVNFIYSYLITCQWSR